jgi:hypothetical protein
MVINISIDKKTENLIKKSNIKNFSRFISKIIEKERRRRNECKRDFY